VIVLASVATIHGASYEYSADGQLVSADYGEKKIWYQYDDSGNLSTVRGPSPLETWRKMTFGTFEATGAAADTAINNGVTNLLRFALGVPSGAMLDSRLQSAWSASGFDVTYWARSDMPTLPVTLEVSTDLVRWTPFTESVQIDSEVGYNLWKATLPTDQPRIFWRIKAGQ